MPEEGHSFLREGAVGGGGHTAEGASHLSPEALGAPRLPPRAGHRAPSPGLCWGPSPKEAGPLLLMSAWGELSVRG